MSLLLDLLFPKKCVGCKKIGTYFCNDCILSISQTDLVCPKCEKLAIGGQTHPICRRKFGLDGLWSLGIYQNPLREAIKQLKYGKVSEIVPVLVDILIEYWVKYQPFVLDQIKKDKGIGWVVIPVPLHWWRENDRGFNQSALFAKTFARKLGLNYHQAIKRTRYTKYQARLRSHERHQNIKNAFEIDPSSLITPQDDKLRSKNYTELVNCLLFDDVWTTGSTIRECCYILKREGAKKVWAITLAR